MNFKTPTGMDRRHFMRHLAGASAVTGSALAMGHTLNLHANTLKKKRKSAILLWMGGGPSTIDIWDLKPDSPTGGEFRPISTTGDVQICEHMPMMAKNMNKMSIIRSMSTREADHGRGRYYMQTGYVPNPNMTHPSYGSVLSHQLNKQRDELEIPPFVSIGGGSQGPGFLGMQWSPFSVNSNGQVRNLPRNVKPQQVNKRLAALEMIEQNFIDGQRGSAAAEHAEVIKSTVKLMSSKQMDAFQIEKEKPATLERYGDNSFGRGCLMARRLVEIGVPFVEVGLGGWDNHQKVFETLKDNKLPVLDRAMSALIEDLNERSMLEDTAIIWMGEFGRTPRINGNSGRDHWARSWSVAVGGAGLKSGIAVGKTNDQGTAVESDPHSSEDLMATICKALDISLETTFTSRSGRPMKIANSGKIIKELFT